MTEFGKQIINMADRIFRGKTITRDEADEAIEYINRCVAPEVSENDICEIGAVLRDRKLLISNFEVGEILRKARTNQIEGIPDALTANYSGADKSTAFYTPKNNAMAWRIIQSLHGCTLSPQDADAIVEELSHVTHRWDRGIRIQSSPHRSNGEDDYLREG